LRYDGGRKSLMIGDQEWPTSSANTFVIGLDERWQPTVRALPVLIKSRGARRRSGASKTPFLRTLGWHAFV
jgi:hypothetical protein